MNIKKSVTLFIQDQQAAVLPIIGLTLLTLMAVTGIAIDSGRLYLVRNKVLAALDAALLGAADVATRQVWEDNPELIQERGREFFRANFPAGYLGTQISDENINIEFNPETGRVSGTVDADIDFAFDGIYNLINLGSELNNFSLGVNSEVLRTVGATYEIALVMDYSFSMCFREGSGRPHGKPRVVDTNCTKFRNLENSVRGFVDTIQGSLETASNQNFTAYYSFVPFNHTVAVNNVSQNQLYCFDENKGKIPPAIGLRQNPEILLDGLFNIVDGEGLPTEGGTNSAVGFWWGWSALRPDSTALFTGISSHENQDEHPANVTRVNDMEVSKLLLLLTDGENEYVNRQCDPPHYRVLGGDDGFYQDTAANGQLAQMCELAKAEGITVATILYDVPPTSDIGATLRACASPGQSYNAQNAEQLGAAFDDIANRLIDLRITQ